MANTSINILAKKIVKEYRIPFEIGAEQPNAETKEAIYAVQKMKADPKFGKTYTDVDAMMGDLLT